jgi:hypothetical protein
LNDQVFDTIKQQAENIGIPSENLEATLLEEKLSQIFKLLLTNAEKESGQAKLEHHFGSINLGFSTDLDNESIDADLAKEYSNTHEQM